MSIGQGIIDVVVPALTGGRPFELLLSWTQQLGPAFLGGYVFVHNLGLACVVPGFGFAAARYERIPRNRGRIGLLLAGSVVLSLVVALQYLLMAHEKFDLRVALPIYLAEAIAVLVLAVPAARELRGFVPTPRYGWSLVHPFRNLRRPFMVSLVTLALLAVVEAALLVG